MSYSRNELQQELSKNLTRLNQLRQFHRIVDTRLQVAQANTYTNAEYGNAVLGKYQKYLALVLEAVQLRTQCDRQLQIAVREESTPSDFEKTLETLANKDYDVFVAWLELLDISPDTLDEYFNVAKSEFLKEQKKRKMEETRIAKPDAAPGGTSVSPGKTA